MREDFMTPEQAADRLRECGMSITPPTLRLGLAQGSFPFGTYIKTEKSCVCFVYAKMLEKWITERF